MWILIETLFSFALMIATFVYIRAFASLLRSFVPGSLADGLDLRFAALAFVTPSFILGGVLYITYYRFGVVWISPTAIYLSWGQDLLYLAGVAYYYFVLRRIRTDPASFELLIRLEEYASWPSTDVVRRPLDYFLFRLPFGKRWQKTTVLIRASDFQKVLNGDLRKIDNAVPVSFSIAAHGDIRTVPHFPVSFKQTGQFANWRQPQTETGDNQDSFEKEPEAPLNRSSQNSQFHVVNRYLHSSLTDEAWVTSRRLCETPPHLIARSWKLFHFQESTRLRFVVFFNTSELILRLLGSIVISILRESGKLPAKMPDGSPLRLPERTSHWIDFLDFNLKKSSLPELEIFHRTLLSRRSDFEEWEQNLFPFQMVLGKRIQFPSERNNVLEGWRILTTLRNKIIGHGGVGAHIQLRPLIYLSAVHSFFLSTMRDVAQLDLGVRIPATTTESDFRTDQGIAFPSIDPAATRAYARLAGSQRLVPLFPYIRFYEGRMLFFDRLRGDQARYVDYNASSVFEPSLLDIKTKREQFIVDNL